MNGSFSQANDAFQVAKLTLTMFKDWYDDSILKDEHGKIKMYVHDKRKGNAFWKQGEGAVFGDGDATIYALASPNIIAHELAHGYIQYTSRLWYNGQAGAINEAFADMTSEATEAYMHGGKADFLFAPNLLKSPRTSLRYMDDPTRDKHSIGHAADYKSGMDVHYASGIYNKAFFVLQQKPGWGVRKAYEVFLRACKMYWGIRTSFVRGVCGVQQATVDRCYDVLDVIDAFCAVGLAARRTCVDASPPAMNFSDCRKRLPHCSNKIQRRNCNLKNSNPCNATTTTPTTTTTTKPHTTRHHTTHTTTSKGIAVNGEININITDILGFVDEDNLYDY